MNKSVASVKREIEQLRQEREKLYSEILRDIDQKIASKHQWIKDNCNHQEDNLIVTVEHQEDEYGKWCESWTLYNIECTVCGRSLSVNKAKFDKTTLNFSDVFRIRDVELNALC